MLSVGRPHKIYEPDFVADSVLDIDFKYLKNLGIKAAFIDLDGTVVERGKYIVNDQITAKLKTQPLKIYIATNRPKSRDLKDLKERLHAQGVIHPRGLLGKPFKSYYKDALKLHNYNINEVVMIGDRYLQDIVGANSAGLYTLVVKKLDKPVNKFDKWLSARERKLTDRIIKNIKSSK